MINSKLLDIENPIDNTYGTSRVKGYSQEYLNDRLHENSNEYGTSQEDGYSQDFINGTILYDNSSGTDTTFQLSDDTENYRCIEIIFGRDASTTYSRSSVKVFEPYGKRAALFLQLSGTSSVYMLVSNITIGHTSMTVGNNREINISNNVSPTLDTDRLISVFKVIGYK